MPPLNQEQIELLPKKKEVDPSTSIDTIKMSDESTTTPTATTTATTTTANSTTMRLRKTISKKLPNMPHMPNVSLRVPNIRAPGRIRRSRSAPAGIGRRKNRLVEQHFNIEKENMALLPGVPKHEHSLARDVHDYFNLIFLVPLIVLDVLNWDFDKLDIFSINSAVTAWNGDYFYMFWNTTLAYFIIDLAWVLIIPRCVKSPSTIIQHHVATILYIFFPYYVPRHRWCMGVLMSVEVNTWFLIARRVFNKQGFPPWTIDLPYLFSVRVKLISIFFYITWIVTRCIIYPAMAFVIYDMRDGDEGQLIYNGVFMLHTVFCILNMKWTWDLANSKIRQWKSNKNIKGQISSGL